MTDRRRALGYAACLIILAVVAFPPAAPAAPGDPHPYVGGATAVVRSGDQTPVDEGTVVCDPDGESLGGACVPFSEAGPDPFVLVLDDILGEQVAFQVCIDNDGDGSCAWDPEAPCGDDVYFSHDDDGNFHNPLGPLPTGFRPGCAGNGGFPGYVVFLCQGAHVPEGDASHVHPATSGTVSSLDSAGPPNAGLGDFCAGVATVKVYVIV